MSEKTSPAMAMLAQEAAKRPEVQQAFKKLAAFLFTTYAAVCGVGVAIGHYFL